MDKILIKDLVVKGIIGLTDKERAHTQNIKVNVVAFTDISKGAISDDIKDCVNYRTLSKAIITLIAKTNRYTVEALAKDIIDICLDTPGVKKARVRVEKPGAVRYAKSVGVEIIR